MNLHDEEEIKSYLYRTKVDGGYLYQWITAANACMTFVPDIDLTRYQSHLRDAYTQGYKDAHEDLKQGISHGSDEA